MITRELAHEAHPLLAADLTASYVQVCGSISVAGVQVSALLPFQTLCATRRSVVVCFHLLCLSQYVLLKGEAKDWLLGGIPPAEDGKSAQDYSKVLVYITARAVLVAVTPKDSNKYVGRANHTLFKTADYLKKHQF